MTPLQLAQSLLEAEHKFGTTDIVLPPEFGDFLIHWGDLHIPDDVLHVEQDEHLGREQEPHITVKYGLKVPDVPEELRAVAKSTAPFSVLLGNVSLFTTNPKYDVVKLGVRSPELHTLNRRVADAVPHEDTYPTYKPHVTLAYVEKGSCDHLEGDNPFQDDVPREFMVSGMNFKAAGDSDDPERAKEVLLFSRSSPAERAAAELMTTESSERNVRQYHDQKHDIMARAANLVESWSRKGLTSEQMRSQLRGGSWGAGMRYWHSRQQFPQAFARFMEQATEYIDNYQENQFAQVPDPFGQCGFPVDPERTGGRRRR